MAIGIVVVKNQLFGVWWVNKVLMLLKFVSCDWSDSGEGATPNPSSEAETQAAMEAIRERQQVRETTYQQLHPLLWVSSTQPDTCVIAGEHGIRLRCVIYMYMYSVACTVGPVLNAWFNNCVLPTLRIQ